MEEPRNDTTQVVEVLNKMLVAIQSLQRTKPLEYVALVISLVALLISFYAAVKVQTVGLMVYGGK